jgi:hypothetical protein
MITSGNSLTFSIRPSAERMKGRIIILILSITAFISCRDKDPVAACKTHALIYDADSVVYAYADGRIKTVLYYGSGNLINRDDIEYNASGQPTDVSKSNVGLDGALSTDSHHSLVYENGRPSQLLSDSYGGHFTTKFKYDESSRLSTAETSSGYDGRFVGITRYEYDKNGDIPKVYYTININGALKEVLARENLYFDNNEKFYSQTPELKILNEYVYGYLPNKNNCLGSTVYYYSYSQHFASPLSINFIATYDDEGQIKSLQTEGQNTPLYSGEVLFKNVVYDCN